jgi:hypothetical protein
LRKDFANSIWLWFSNAIPGIGAQAAMALDTGANRE